MKLSTLAILVGASLLIATAARARNTFLDIPVNDARESHHAETLLDVPFYMAGEPHPKIEKNLGEVTSNRRTNAFNKTDQDACHLVFLSAIIALQERARADGGNAIVEIKSITKHRDLSSPTEFRCVAGGIVANVALSGRIVRLAPPEVGKPPNAKKRSNQK